MGNCVSARSHPVSFDIREKTLLDQQFSNYCDRGPETRRHGAMSLRCLVEAFPENPRFGRKLFNFLEVYGQQNKYISQQVLNELLEVMVKDNSVSTNERLKHFEKLELMALISIEPHQFLEDFSDIKNYSIQYLQAIEIVIVLLVSMIYVRIYQGYICLGRITQALMRGQQRLQSIACLVWRSISLFKAKEAGEVQWTTMITYLSQQLPGANAAKFMGLEFPLQLPTLSQPSYIINDEWLFQLYLSTPTSKLPKAQKLELLYSTIWNEGGFDALLQSLIKSERPTLLLIQHEETYPSLHDNSVQSVSHVFGGIRNLKWCDGGCQGGSENDCLLSLYPEYRVIRARRDRRAEKNYSYMNSSTCATCGQDRPQGIGFGGVKGKFRVWLDRDLVSSYCHTEDGSYEQGVLIRPHTKTVNDGVSVIKKLNINLIEAWAIIENEEIDNFDPYSQDYNDPLRDFKSQREKKYYWEDEPKADFYWMQESESEDDEPQKDEEIEDSVETTVVTKVKTTTERRNLQEKRTVATRSSLFLKFLGKSNKCEKNQQSRPTNPISPKLTNSKVQRRHPYHTQTIERINQNLQQNLNQPRMTLFNDHHKNLSMKPFQRSKVDNIYTTNIFQALSSRLSSSRPSERSKPRLDEYKDLLERYSNSANNQMQRGSEPQKNTRMEQDPRASEPPRLDNLLNRYREESSNQGTDRIRSEKSINGNNVPRQLIVDSILSSYDQRMNQKQNK